MGQYVFSPKDFKLQDLVKASKSATAMNSWTQFGISIVATLFLTGFDFVSEPVAVKLGHQVWHHCAYVDPSLSSFVRKPDWIFDASDTNSNMKSITSNVPLQVLNDIFLTFMKFLFVFHVIHAFNETDSL